MGENNGFSRRSFLKGAGIAAASVAASTLLAQQGYSVITLEKEGDTGGTTQEAHSFYNLAGTGSEQKALGYYPEGGFPEKYDRDAFVRGIIGKCLTGLLVDPEMRVMGADDKPIPGLYANMMTAGGACGASSYCGNLVNTSIVGGNGLSWTTGYLAAKTAMADSE